LKKDQAKFDADSRVAAAKADADARVATAKADAEVMIIVLARQELWRKLKHVDYNSNRFFCLRSVLCSKGPVHFHPADSFHQEY
jgi:hypothetical protein